MDRRQFRQQLLERRAQLTPAQRKQADQQLQQRALEWLNVHSVQSVGSYVSVKAEIATAQLNQQLMREMSVLAVPRLHPVVKNHLLFLRMHAQTQWVPNAYRIPEPKLQTADIVPLSQLQVLLVPMVGFDAHGNRLGMGGGFYDRTLAAWRLGRYPNLLPVGLAYDCQYVDRLPIEAWDVPLPMVITPAKVWDFRP